MSDSLVSVWLSHLPPSRLFHSEQGNSNKRLKSISPLKRLPHRVEQRERNRIVYGSQWRQQKVLPLLSVSGIFYDSTANNGHPFYQPPKDDRPYLFWLPFSPDNKTKNKL